MTTTRVAQSLADLDPYVDQWDELAVSVSRPLLRPAWLLSWWRGERERDGRSELRVVLVLDGNRLVGVFPLHVRDPEARIPVHEVLGGGRILGPGAAAGALRFGQTVPLLTEALARILASAWRLEPAGR